VGWEEEGTATDRTDENQRQERENEGAKIEKQKTRKQERKNIRIEERQGRTVIGKRTEVRSRDKLKNPTCFS
jgi:hypothetical protein